MPVDRVHLPIIAPGVAAESEATASPVRSIGALWRAEPFRPFFVLGLLLGWVGVSHWLFYTTGLSKSYSGMTHGLVQMQGFMMAFACGFLMTALPRRTRSQPPSALELGGAAGLITLSAAGAVMERWAIAEGAYLGVLLILAQFAIRRFRAGADRRSPPNGFVLVPLGLASGATGAVLLLAHTLGGAAPWTVALGRQLVQQGVFLCLVLGIGSLVLPLVRGDAPPHDATSSRRDRAAKAAFFAAGVALLGSFAIELFVSQRGGLLLRGVVCTAVLVLGAGAWRRPAKSGFHRWLVVIAAWLVPAGLVLAGFFPAQRVGALHLLFIGGLGLLVFAVATHVTVSHAGPVAAAFRSSPAIIAMAALFLVALVARLGAELSPELYFPHLAYAAIVWLAGSAAWAAHAVPRLLRSPAARP